MKNRIVVLAALVLLGLGFVTALSVSVAKTRQNEGLRSEVNGLQDEVTALSAQVTRLIEQRPVTKTVDFDALALPVASTSSNGMISVEVHAAELETLHAALAERNAELEQLQAKLAATATDAPSREERQQSRQTSFMVRMRERMEQLQKDNPEEYERIQKEQQDRRLQLANATHERADFFKNVNTEGLPTAYQENHAALVQKLQSYEDAMARILADPDSEESQALRRETFASLRDIRGLMQTERKVLLTDFANQLGYSQDESSQFVDYVDYVNEMTTAHFPHMGGGGGRNRGRGDSQPGPTPGN